MIGQGFRRRRAVTLNTILMAMASTISVACAFFPATLLPQIEMRRPVIQARRLWRSARSQFIYCMILESQLPHNTVKFTF